MKFQIQREPDALDLPVPAYATDGASGMDLYAAVIEPVTLLPGERQLISTGIRIALSPGCEAQIRPRSGLARNHGISMVNSPGTVDADFRGVVSVVLVNLGQAPVTVERGDRIAQMVVAPVIRVEWEEVVSLPETDRGEGGFGHTGR